MTARALNWRSLGLGKMAPLPDRAKAKRKRKVQIRPLKAAPPAQEVELALAELGVPRGQRIICDYPPNALSSNARPNRWDKAKAAKAYKQDCFVLARAACVTLPAAGQIAVRLDVFPPDRRARDDDNPEGAFKNGRDGIALALKVDDNRFDIVTRQFHRARPIGCVVFTIIGDAA
ncbi:hypothetical protein [Sphingomonas montanisoli]|uniref:Uncharacterized protein n=1 Tax=Sphingomonas montanisoli TaxID=2606412 RepID=A0A5D9BZL7_9SPHN|nr:hypothetical protein [Sphingomonas montanisoli]TZG24884.1 hypothetical protein FYJ91_16515 [Sphingomonas montanisoli]